MSGTLYIVSTPIGNFDDITFRALRTLKESDIIVCEEFKVGAGFLRHFGIQKELFKINEHNETNDSSEIINFLIEGKNVSLISDCGTPVFSDPGFHLIQLAFELKIKVVPIPGVDSVIPSLVISGFDISCFFYAGWLSPKKEIRIIELQKIQKIKKIVVIMETPYRLKQLLNDCQDIFSADIEICLATNLTTSKEKFFRGTISSIIKEISIIQEKFEFVLILNNTSVISLIV